ncbi:MAG: hypothetical protein J7463_02185 [Roseiflexus sp.]|jgi:hypothetical protein|nr:hypothetical protein [Roseiflexus sp.]MBO9333978.1 hypothetical protein [Roseiflexus sp.]MBO9365273.1 hypothetical protein [Roseiflexus sp.]MBO9388795.1 hypothetical protein [Roseiflexus sp.]
MIRVTPRNRRLIALVDQLLDEELSRLSVDSQNDGVSLSPSARAAVIEIVTRTIERVAREKMTAHLCKRASAS